MVMGVKNVARRCKKTRATKFIGMGNKIYNDGQQNLSERATEFIGTGNDIFTQIPLFFRKRRAYRIFFFAAHYIYMRLQKKNQYLIAGRSPKRFFFSMRLA